MKSCSTGLLILASQQELRTRWRGCSKLRRPSAWRGRRVRGCPVVCQKLILWIKLRYDEDKYFHLPDGPVADARGNEDAAARLEGNEFIVKLHLGVGLALEDVIGLRQ